MTSTPGAKVELSVVAATHRRPANLEQFIESLNKQTLDRDTFEIVICDDASGDRTADVLRKAADAQSNLRWTANDVNRGPATARNRALEMTVGKIILFLDDDIASAPNLLERHLTFHRERNDPWCSMLGRIDWHPSLRVTPFMRFVDRSGFQFAYETWLRPGLVEEPYRTFVLANTSVSREAATAVGGLDERFRPPFLAYEDYEFGWRLAQRGLRLWYDPDALAYHTRPIDLRTFRRRMAMVAESTALLRRLQPEFPLAESLLQNRLPRRRYLKLRAYAPIARWLGDDERLDRVYREQLAESYAEGRRRGEQRIASFA